MFQSFIQHIGSKRLLCARHWASRVGPCLRVACSCTRRALLGHRISHLMTVFNVILEGRKRGKVDGGQELGKTCCGIRHLP